MVVLCLLGFRWKSGTQRTPTIRQPPAPHRAMVSRGTPRREATPLSRPASILLEEDAALLLATAVFFQTARELGIAAPTLTSMLSDE